MFTDFPNAGHARRVTTLALRPVAPQRGKGPLCHRRGKRHGNPKILPAKHAKGTLNFKGESFLFSRLFACLAGNVPVSFLVFSAWADQHGLI